MRGYVLVCSVAGSLLCPPFAKAVELDSGSGAIRNLEKLSDVDLGLTYFRAQHKEQKSDYSLGSPPSRQHLLAEVRKRGSTQLAEAIYDGFISSACAVGSFASGYARIVQDGAELNISDEARLLRGVVIKDTVVMVIPMTQETLIGNIFADRVDLVSTSGSCSMSFARTVNLHDAVRSGRLDVVQSVIKSGADVNEPDAWGTPLGIAVITGSDNMVKLLIEAGADVEEATVPAVGGQRPLHLAATRPSAAYTARLLISHGAQLEGRDKVGKTPLITAVLADNFEVANMLLAAGADIEAVDSDLGATPLSWAACLGRIRAVEFLVSKGAHINKKSGPEGDTPLHRAVACCKLPHEELIKFLVGNGADVNAKNKNGRTPIKLAFSSKERALLRSLGAEE